MSANENILEPICPVESSNLNWPKVFLSHSFAESELLKETFELIEKLGLAQEEAVKASMSADEWTRHSLSSRRRSLHLEILRAELELERAKEFSKAQSVYDRIVWHLSRALHKAKGVLTQVCHGIVKLGASADGVRPNFLTDYLLPLPRNDKIYA